MEGETILTATSSCASTNHWQDVCENNELIFHIALSRFLAPSFGGTYTLATSLEPWLWSRVSWTCWVALGLLLGLVLRCRGLYPMDRVGGVTTSSHGRGRSESKRDRGLDLAVSRFIFHRCDPLSSDRPARFKLCLTSTSHPLSYYTLGPK